jgi:hypothetical protein
MKEYECIVGRHKTTEVKAATIGESSCCMPCAVANNHPGKFQQYSCSDEHDFINYQSESMGKALILYGWSMDDSYVDDRMGPDGWGSITRLHNYLLNESDSGFVDFDEYESVEKAQKVWDDLYSDGWGQSEYDIFLSFDRGKWHAFDGDAGKEIEVWPNHEGEITRDRVLAAISLHMRKTGCFPDIWEVNDHGNVTSIGSEVW